MDIRTFFSPFRVTVVASFLFVAGSAAAQGTDAAAQPRWFKGNLHTHTLWSDGDDYPEMVADWYKRNGYHFLGLSDHNVLQEGTRWFELKTPVAPGGVVNQRGGGPVLEQYLRRFGPDWVEQKEEQGKKFVRLKPLDEYRSLLEEPGRFLMVPMEEITSTWKRAKTATTPEQSGPVHINITNVREFVPPAEGDNAVTVMDKVLESVAAQREKTGQPMFAHINHPNFRYGITGDELMQVKRERFFEVYNGHPGVINDGDANHLSMDAMWDAMLARRLTDLKLDLVYGVGVDDSHHYHAQGLGKSNSGRGWVMVRAKHLTAESLVKAMEAGDFYASNGVTLSDLKRDAKSIALAVQSEPGVTYTIQFIGTRHGFDPKTELLEAEKGGRTLAHRRYSKDVGVVLAEVKGTSASYTLKGDEIYVRAKVISTKKKVNGSVENEVECAWVQPIVGARK